jgi:plasmid stabilization system protein ParE
VNLFYTPEAISDSERLRAFIAANNPSAAQKKSTELLTGIANLNQLLHLGRNAIKAPNPEMMRDLSVSLYIVR